MTDSSPPPGDNDDHHDVTPAESSSKPAPEGSSGAVEASASSPPRDAAAEDHPAVTGGKSSGDENSNNADEEHEEREDDDEDDEEDDDEDDGDDDDAEDEDAGDNDEEDDDEEEEDDEPKLKYARLTPHLGPLYRNGDATSSFLVAGDKMVVGTHNGNIHVVQLPAFQSLRVYHAHAASVTSISISPFPPPLPTVGAELASQSSPNSPLRPGTGVADAQTAPAAASRRPRDPQPVPNIPSNSIYVATSSMDGNICVQSLIEPKDVSLRNFARPVQAVALSPEFKSDRMYLSGGLAGQLILTSGAPTGRSTATTTGATAQAAGWLGNMVGAGTGKDTVLHSGEGTINTIKWSLSGKYVVWLNEHGIKIMRTKLHLENADAEDAWKRIGHIDRPQTEEWETMASVWKGRVEWIDEQAVESDEATPTSPDSARRDVVVSPAAESLRQQHLKTTKKYERLLVGWGGTIWIIHVHPGEIGTGRNVGEKSAGRAEIVKILRMDCIISGISLYTHNLLLVLAYCLPDDEEGDRDGENQQTRSHTRSLSGTSTGSGPSGGIQRKQNNQPPELRLIDLSSQAEVDKDGLTISRFERLSSNDYHLGILPARNVAAAVSSRGTLETLAGLGNDVLNAALNPLSLFSSAVSVVSRGSDGGSGNNVPASGIRVGRTSVHPHLVKPGVKIFIHSPYDCILATRRDLIDHLTWLLEHNQYQDAWQLVDEHPEITSGPPDGSPNPPSQTQGTDDFYDDSASVAEGIRSLYSSAEKEKRRIGELWIQEVIETGDWTKAGEICGKVLSTPDRWENWVWTFAGADKFDEIVNHIPAERTRPPMPGTIYEVMLGRYLQTNKPTFGRLLERWSPDLYNVSTITTALEDQLKFRDVREDSIEDGEVGRDWRIVMESLAKLHEANGRTREALRCHIKLQDADSAMRLIKEGHLADAVADDIPSFIGLRVPQHQAKKMSRLELEEATEEPITLLVDEAQHGLVKPEVVVGQLQEKKLDLYTFFYLRGLWRGEGIHEHSDESRARLVTDSKSLVDQFADLAVHLFAVHDQSLLMDFLKTSTAYAFEKAAQECETHNYVPELVYLYSKTGQTKRALYLIIDRLGDVSHAIAFAKDQDDPDLWEDLLTYSMDKPRFIRALLEEVGTAINPITLVRRIPEGLEIEGLREGLKHIMKEHEIQFSICEGVARVLRSEVAAAQGTLRMGQRKGIKFEVAPAQPAAADGAHPPQAQPGDAAHANGNGHAVVPAGLISPRTHNPAKKWAPGLCAECLEPFDEWELETLVGFTCGHVFHLAHLLGDQANEMLLKGFGGGDPRSVSATHLIGAKVTHARLLRDRIAGGCPVCAAAKKEEEW
ncbi:uncharacterized protein C8A04DRAFT_14425 [Dichotomopilus funicola]|uniref:Vps41 beta-propeller domain-containing protein n=1 Tax=Dichotomopilus funicola TaxID=1934379 RepID=A0AAN6UXZ3_9PEZI|nr:hypothetical protein C8A04DRAFT_14425 [Dichotomopilus funicola]